MFFKASTRINFEVTINQHESDLVHYADDNTQHACSENSGINLEKIEEVQNILSEWFSTNFLRQMLTNVISFEPDEYFSMNMGNKVTKIVMM